MLTSYSEVNQLRLLSHFLNDISQSTVFASQWLQIITGTSVQDWNPHGYRPPNNGQEWAQVIRLLQHVQSENVGNITFRHFNDLLQVSRAAEISDLQFHYSAL